MEGTNRSNSSSRVISQHSRISYLNVNGEQEKVIPQNRIPVIPAPQQINKFIMPVAARPSSNVSNQSSQSRRSI